MFLLLSLSLIYSICAIQKQNRETFFRSSLIHYLYAFIFPVLIELSALSCVYRFSIIFFKHLIVQAYNVNAHSNCVFKTCHNIKAFSERAKVWFICRFFKHCLNSSHFPRFIIVLVYPLFWRFIIKNATWNFA